MALLDRDHALERKTLERVARIADEPAFPDAIRQRLDDVEAAGGPAGGGVATPRAAFAEARDEYIDGPAWSLLGLQLLANQPGAGAFDGPLERVRLVVEEAMSHAAHAAHLMTGVLDELEASSTRAPTTPGGHRARPSME